MNAVILIKINIIGHKEYSKNSCKNDIILPTLINTVNSNIIDSKPTEISPSSIPVKTLKENIDISKFKNEKKI